MTFSQTPVNDNANVSDSVHKGQTIIVTSEITVPAWSRSDINITISAPQSPASAVDLVVTGVVFVGRNIPCLRKQMFSADVSSWYDKSPALQSLSVGTTSRYIPTHCPDKRR